MFKFRWPNQKPSYTPSPADPVMQRDFESVPANPDTCKHLYLYQNWDSVPHYRLERGVETGTCTKCRSTVSPDGVIWEPQALS